MVDASDLIDMRQDSAAFVTLLVVYVVESVVVLELLMVLCYC